jgi:hypothetical protein
MLEELILENYIPLLSSDIHKVELNTQHMVNLFISANGSGKTSILKEVNPMPPENSNYKNGRKYAVWRFGGKRYIMDSYTGVGNGHSFKIDDGPELNTGGTYSAQRELVGIHCYGLDASLVKMFGGLRLADRLSVMSPARRKDIIMQVYPNNTDYALGVFNKLKTERNELKAAIKNQNGRWAEENRKLSFINECGVEVLEERIKGIESELREALMIRGSLNGIKLDSDLDLKVSQFKQLCDQLVVNRLSGQIFTENELKNMIDLNGRILDQHKEQAAILGGIISEHASHLDGMEEFLKDPDAFKEHAEHIKEDMTRLKTKIAEFDGGLSRLPVFSDPETPLEGLDHCADGLIAYLNRVTVASEQTLTGAIYKNYLTTQETLAASLRHYKQTLDDVSHKLAHYESAENVNCPDCSHEFKLGITPAELESLRQQKAALITRVDKIEQEQSVLLRKIENDADWYLSMNQLFSFIRENNHVRVLPELIKEFEVGKVASVRLLNALELFMKKAKLVGELKNLAEEESLLDARLALLDRNNVLDMAIYVANIEKDLVLENNKITHYKEKLMSQINTLKAIQSHKSDVQRLDALRHEIMSGLIDQGKYQFKSAVDDRISDLSEEKEHNLTSIIKSKSLTAVVQSISSDIERMKKRLVIVEVLMDGLCPNKGLIGKLMTDFIKAICGNMNAVLKDIWNTPLFIKPCSKDNGDLTYKFPVVKGEKDPTPDVADCSGGEMDIIDWAWRFVLLGYHKFPFPLLMDEVGIMLDEIKRGRFFNFIQEYVKKPGARQLFLVSHYFNQYGAFDSANFIALRYEGLTLAGEVNLHSKIG